LLTQQKVGISYDLFTHTDTENHHKITQDFFLKLLQTAACTKKLQELMYSELEKRFPARSLRRGRMLHLPTTPTRVATNATTAAIC